MSELSAGERRVCDAIAEREAELVELVSALVGFDTTAREPHEPAREERALQEHLAARLERAGARVDLWEPRPEDVAGHRLCPEGGIGFEGRPQLAATFGGRGGGRSLLLNGHIDAVSAEPRERWTSDPHRAEVREGRLYGRGACDMKAGVACMTLAAEVLAGLGGLAGDVVVCTNTDEESSGVGGLACVARGVRADAGIVTEPTGFDVWAGCRGTSYATVTVPGRPGHAELSHPGWREGGPVNAIVKATVVVEALAAARERFRAGGSHPFLSPPDVVPTLMHAGEWAVTYPASAELTVSACFVPGLVGADGWGDPFEQELETFVVERCAGADDWLAERPPSFHWHTRVPSMEIPREHPLLGIALDVAEERTGRRRVSGLDSWYDGATFTLFGGTPAIGFGPHEISAAHTIDEYVPVADLVPCAQALAVMAMRWCGAAEAP